MREPKTLSEHLDFALAKLNHGRRLAKQPEIKPRCEQYVNAPWDFRCALPAVAAFDWPGAADLTNACQQHLEWTQQVAKALGFALRFDRYEPARAPNLRKITLP